MIDREYSFHLVPGDDYKSKYLIYEELGYKLSIYLESAGGWKYDWGAVDVEFNQWTEPKGQTISTDKKAQILYRIGEWSRKEKIRIHVGPPIDKEKMFSDYQKKGWKVEKLSDGSTRVSPPPKYGIIKRINDLLRGL